MLPNTFDVPAYKFALVKFDGDILSKCNNNYEFLSKFIIDNPSLCHFISFENFDGLTVEELIKLFCQEHSNFYFIGYTSLSYDIGNGNKATCNNILLNLALLDLGNDVRIDEFIKNYMIGNYKAYNEQVQRIFRCFLERYCYRNQEEVSEIIR